MSKLRRLQVLVLKSNKLFGHVVQSLTDEESTCAFPNAIIIDISSNNFSGPLPKDKWFKKLESMLHIDTNTSLVMDHAVPSVGLVYRYKASLTYKGHDTTLAQILRTLVFIDFSNNAFNGSIPEIVGELVLTHGINMSHNFLTGPIPSQLGGLKQLEALDLSSNQLSGVIPQELASLDFLEMLNLSYNKLEGKIPESLHFLTFTNSSFLGNNDLCGPPLSKGCINMTILNVIPSKKKSVDIVLFLFSGLGFGLGLAIAVVVSWGIPIRKQATRHATERIRRGSDSGGRRSGNAASWEEERLVYGVYRPRRWATPWEGEKVHDEEDDLAVDRSEISPAPVEKSNGAGSWPSITYTTPTGRATPAAARRSAAPPPLLDGSTIGPRSLAIL
uniref:Leucine-rich repeat-containing N-terminal plant-type domain-containing protein n=1 Tax=Oryza nivara TaxID=4536 RepID=A0A0E0FGS1_ORYNI